MEQARIDSHLSQITTLWTEVLAAHAAEDRVTAALGTLLQRYCGAAYRYLLGAVHDPDVAAELAQEFALRFVRGDFRRADPRQGRFRDYLKTSLIHLVNDYWRSRRAWPRPLVGDLAEPPSAGDSADSDQAFIASWREELLQRTWQALTDENPFYSAALRGRIANPDLSSAALAEQLTTELGKPHNAAQVRKTLQRAHAKYADLLITEVAVSLGTLEPARLREELRELDLLKYCQSALERRAR